MLVSHPRFKIWLSGTLGIIGSKLHFNLTIRHAYPSLFVCLNCQNWITQVISEHPSKSHVVLSLFLSRRQGRSSCCTLSVNFCATVFCAFTWADNSFTSSLTCIKIDLNHQFHVDKFTRLSIKGKICLIVLHNTFDNEIVKTNLGQFLADHNNIWIVRICRLVSQPGWQLFFLL